MKETIIKREKALIIRNQRIEIIMVSKVRIFGYIMSFYHSILVVMPFLSIFICRDDKSSLITGEGNVVLFQFESPAYSISTAIITTIYALSQYTFCIYIKKIWYSQFAVLVHVDNADFLTSNVDEYIYINHIYLLKVINVVVLYYKK